MAVAALVAPYVVNKYGIFEEAGYVPHTGQKPVHDSLARFRVLVAGRRWGKSLSAAMEAIPMILTPGTRGWVVSKTYDLTRKVTREIYRIMIQEWGMRNHLTKNQQGGPIVMEFDWGSSVEGKSAEHPPSLIGEGLDWIIVDEAAKIKQGIWEQYLRPTLTDRVGWALFISTPEGYNWFHALYKRGLNPAFPNWESFHEPSWNNPYLSQEEIDEAKGEMTDAVFRQEYGADFTISAGQVYQDFKEHIHIIPEDKLKVHPDWPRYRAIDFGYEDPFVCLWIAVDPDDRVIVYDEYYRSRRINERHAKHLVKEKKIKVFPKRQGGQVDYVPVIRNRYVPAFDTKDTKYEWTVADVSGKSARRTLRRYGIPTVAQKQDIDAGLEMVRKILEVREDGTPGFYLSTRCPETANEFNQYSYPDVGILNREKPIDANNHACFVAGTQVMTQDGAQNIEDIEAGDMVLTRDGYHKVVEAGCTGMREVVKATFSDERGFVATPDHPIIAGGRRIPLHSLRYSDIIYTVDDLYNEQGDILCQKSEESKKLFLRGSSTEDTPTQKAMPREPIFAQVMDVAAMELGDSIRKFGNTPTERFRQSMTYTTLILIHRITSYLIWCAFQEKNIKRYTLKERAVLANHCHRKLLRQLTNGIAQTQVERFIVASGGLVTKMPRIVTTNVLCAESNINQGTCDKGKANIAPMPVNPHTDGSKAWIMSRGSVSSAVTSIPPTNTGSRKPVRLLAVEPCVGEQNVYNVEVEGQHEYLANGILVGNCDALRYFVHFWKGGIISQRRAKL